MVKIAVLASGSGSNALKLFRYFENSRLARVEMIVTNNPKAGVIDRFQGIKTTILVFNPSTDSSQTLEALNSRVDVLLLAGYMRLIPKDWTNIFHNRILNIHPALLPKHGGKGMYGKRVHKAVSESGDVESGITVHMVNERYDEGAIIAQFKVQIEPGEAPGLIEQKVRSLEKEHYAPTAAQWIMGLTSSL
ncbi:MAG: phosphoribosylglycinamide formyltransferase [Flavobacteriales bacterium]|nr:phosphoribosylglycinamide formyltransferase [Flavobacteriales bacterium]|tara:strand:+ start:2818 stop:3390 length:573 start_codon:yes stop_codon:yes gene_type:complete